MTTDRCLPTSPWEAVVQTLLEECRRRPVWLCEIAELVARYSSTEGAADLRVLTLKAVRALLQHDGTKCVLDRIDVAPKCVLDRIDHAWMALGRQPLFGEIAFLRRHDSSPRPEV